ncbi:hypothetical protein V9T40_000865 [Parthenolecanium corni]|uniref:Uncharacterized protein n=1 Tax=Parthenolecanium corni TaxID=536013 RepID=A0AAN9TBS9_9HEMI
MRLESGPLDSGLLESGPRLGPLMSVLPSYSANKSSLLLVPRTSNFLHFSLNSNQKEKNSEQNVASSSESDETEWSNWIIFLSRELYNYHDRKARSYFRYESSVKEGERLMEKEKSAYKEILATYRLICKMEDVARRLIDDHVIDQCRVFYLDRAERWVLEERTRKYDFYQIWMSLLNSSKQPLAETLKQKLSEADLTPQIFSRSMKKIHFELANKRDSFRTWSSEFIHFGPDDIMNVLNNLPINDTDLKCIIILFNLDEPDKWQIMNKRKEM